MDPYERFQVADCLKPVEVAKGTYICKQGDKGSEFFLLEKGECIATKVLETGKQP